MNREKSMFERLFHRDASNRLVFDLSNVSADDYSTICDEVAAALHLTKDNTLVDGWDAVFQDYRRGSQVVGLEWDNWSGFIVVAKIEASEPLVREIAEWLLQSQWASAPTSKNATPSP